MRKRERCKSVNDGMKKKIRDDEEFVCKNCCENISFVLWMQFEF